MTVLFRNVEIWQCVGWVEQVRVRGDRNRSVANLRLLKDFMLLSKCHGGALVNANMSITARSIVFFKFSLTRGWMGYSLLPRSL